MKKIVFYLCLALPLIYWVVVLFDGEPAIWQVPYFGLDFAPSLLIVFVPAVIAFILGKRITSNKFSAFLVMLNLILGSLYLVIGTFFSLVIPKSL